MATVITTPQVGNSYCPQMRLTATISSQTATKATIHVVIDYITHGYTFSSNSSPEVSEKIDGTWYDEEGWSLNGKTSQTVRTRNVTVNKTTSARSVGLQLYWAMSGFRWSGSAMSNWNLSDSITVPAITSYTVTYNANGGSGAPSNQTKWHGTNITLSTAEPTRADYNFIGWATSADATTAEYQPGATYTGNANLTLYAVWQLAYVPPTIDGLAAIRCASDGTADDSGTYAKVTFNWSVDTTIYPDNTVSSVEIAYSVHGAASWTTTTVSASGTSGSVSKVLGTFNTATSYDIRATVTDAHGNASMYVILSQAFFTLDVLAGGHGIAFGKAAATVDTFENAYENVSYVGQNSTLLLTMDELISILGAADYVVEESHTSTGGYRKWNSGKMEAWTRRDITTAISTSFGNLYRSNYYYDGGAWPTSFLTITHCFASLSANGSDMAFLGMLSAATTTHANNVYLLRGQSLSSSKAFTIDWYGVGTWK